MESLTRIFEHMTWADNRTLGSLREMREAPNRAIELFAHVIAAEHVWLARIEQRTPEVEVWPKLSLDECDRLMSANHRAYLGLLSRTDSAALNANVKYKTVAGKEFSNSLRDILLHVTYHGMYHRGQVAMLVREAGGDPKATDMIVLVRETST